MIQERCLTKSTPRAILAAGTRLAPSSRRTFSLSGLTCPTGADRLRTGGRRGTPGGGRRGSARGRRHRGRAARRCAHGAPALLRRWYGRGCDGPPGRACRTVAAGRGGSRTASVPLSQRRGRAGGRVASRAVGAVRSGPVRGAHGRGGPCACTRRGGATARRERGVHSRGAGCSPHSARVSTAATHAARRAAAVRRSLGERPVAHRCRTGRRTGSRGSRIHPPDPASPRVRTAGRGDGRPSP